MYKGKTVTCIVPARMSSSRFPGKPLVKIHGRELVLRVADIAKEAKHVDRVIVATEDQVIKDLVDSQGYEGWITGSHYTCTHRVAEVSSHLECDYIFNLQGDEPLVIPSMIDDIIEWGINHDSDMVQPYRKTTKSEYDDPDSVNMIINNGRFVHLQREPDTITDNLVSQIGMYFYKRSVIADFPNLDMTWVEHWKGLDTIGFVGAYHIDAMYIPYHGHLQGVDRPQHVEIVEQIYNTPTKFYA